MFLKRPLDFSQISDSETAHYVETPATMDLTCLTKCTDGQTCKGKRSTIPWDFAGYNHDNE